MMTCWRVPTLRLSRFLEIACWCAMKRCQRSSVTSFGTAAARSFDTRAVDRLVAEAADAIERGFVEPVEQHLEVLLGLAREADDEGRAQRQIGADLAPARDAASVFSCAAGRFMRLSTSGEACWNGMSR